MARHLAWRVGNFLRWHFGADGQSAAAPPTLRCAPAATNRTVTVYPGKAPSGKPRVLVASAYVPFPLSHGGAVRIHNLTARAAADWDQILVAFTETDAPPAAELLERFVEVVLVRRTGTHAAPSTGRPEVVEQFASAPFRAALRESVRKWRPAIAQLEFTQMAQYAADCAPARPILVEHDITFDLYQQLRQTSDDWDLRHQLKLWRRFETAAWRKMACVVTMSEKDCALVAGTRAAVLPNGVDLGRFRVALQAPEPRRLLFVGSFSHLPNLMAVAFFLDQVWPRLRDARLHIIAGARHEYFLDYHGSQVKVRLDQPGVEVEGFVADVRGAYERAAIVVAPLVVSAGTNLKILEAMACGRPVVATPAGVNGLDLVPGEDFMLVHTAAEMAAAIENLLASPGECHRLAVAGRRRVEDWYGWDKIARRQTELYREVMAER
jgi:glycosyltransferase involved in cell wall biosynthesis